LEKKANKKKKEILDDLKKKWGIWWKIYTNHF
jgi:hypothetical protein